MPGDEKESKTDFAIPPPGTQLGSKILTFCRFSLSFFYCFFECRFGRPPGVILGGFGKVFRYIFEHLLLFFDVKRRLGNVILCCSLQ